MTDALPDLPDLKQLAEWSYGMSRSVRAACRVETAPWDELSEEQQWVLERITSDALTKGMEIGFSDPRLIGERNKWFNEAQATKALLNEAAEVLREADKLIDFHFYGDNGVLVQIRALLSKLEGQ